MIYECANCGTWRDGAGYFPSDAPRDAFGVIPLAYKDAVSVRYCSDECRDAAESAPVVRDPEAWAAVAKAGR